MNYLENDTNLKHAVAHLRNKNLSIFYDHTRFVQKLVNRLSDAILQYRTNLMVSNKRCRLVISEQIVELPLVFKNLREGDKKILDFGGVEGILPLQLSALGYHVTVLDQRLYPFSHPNLNVICGDLFAKDLKITDTFNVIISISVIEHLGLGSYGDSVVHDADKKGVEILWSLLKKGGRLMASVPAGKPAVQRGYRVYNEKRIRETFPDIEKIHWFAKAGREGTWGEVQAERIESLVYSEPYGQMPVEGVAFIICEKKTE